MGGCMGHGRKNQGREMTDRTHPDSGRIITSGAAIQRYKIGYHADEWGQRSSTPSGIPDASGSWVRYADHVTALAAGQATAAQAVVQDDLITLRKPTTSAELLWLLKLAHLVISDVDKTLEDAFAPAQPAPVTQQSHQQEAQEPAAVVVPCHTPSGKRVALYSAKQDLPIGTQLYTAPLPSPTTHPADSVQEEAARYRWLRDGNDAKHGAAWHVAVNLYGCEWDAAIDAARKRGASHDR